MELQFFPYKIQILEVEAKRPGDKLKRLNFALETQCNAVWCAMSDSEHGLIGPFVIVFNNTVNSLRYREMLNDFFFPRLRALRIPLATTCFQQE